VTLQKATKPAANDDRVAFVLNHIGGMTITEVKKLKVSDMSSMMKVLGLTYEAPKPEAAQKLFDKVRAMSTTSTS
jgi:hypothetical protein